MKFSFNFLKEFVPVSVSPQELAQQLTLAGIEVVSLQRAGNDWILEVEITANRPDLLSIAGLSYEVAGIVRGTSRIALVKTKEPAQTTEIAIHIEDRKDCPYYRAVLVEQVHVTDAPVEMREAITKSGFLPVNNVVDSTNYCMLKWGHPLHAFDRDRIKGDIFVRRAREGEKLFCIDNKERMLSPQNLVIADREKVIALAGVIGGKETEITPATTSILLEAALFSKGVIRTGRRKAGVSTESSYRFEREVVPLYVLYAQDEAAVCIQESAGGTITGSTAAGGLPEEKREPISLSVAKLNAYLGSGIDRTTTHQLLEHTQCTVVVKDKDTLTVTPPFFRKDIRREVDLYEEVARRYGYDKIPLEIPSFGLAAETEAEKAYAFKNTLRVFLRGERLREIIPYSFLNEQAAAYEKNKARLVEIANPLKKDERFLRPQLYLTALEVIRHNVRNSHEEIRFFEIGDVVYRERESYREKTRIGIYFSGEEKGIFFALKKVVENLTEVFCAEKAHFSEQPSDFFSQALRIVIKDTAVGFLGIVDDAVLGNLGISQRLFFAEIELDLLLDACIGRRAYKEFSRFPEVVRDISIALESTRTFAYVQQKISAHAPQYLKDILVVETYQGEKLGEGLRGYTLRLIYQSGEKTLSNEEVEGIHNKLRTFLAEDVDILLR